MMQRYGIIYLHTYTFRQEIFFKSIPFFCPDYILIIDMIIYSRSLCSLVFINSCRKANITTINKTSLVKHLFITLSVSPSTGMPLGKIFKFYIEYRGLHCVKPEIPANNSMMIFRSSAMDAENTQFFSQIQVVGNDHSTITHTA